MSNNCSLASGGEVLFYQLYLILLFQILAAAVVIKAISLVIGASASPSNAGSTWTIIDGPAAENILGQPVPTDYRNCHSNDPDLRPTTKIEFHFNAALLTELNDISQVSQYNLQADVLVPGITVPEPTAQAFTVFLLGLVDNLAKIWDKTQVTVAASGLLEDFFL